MEFNSGFKGLNESENRPLKRMLRQKREEVRGWINLHNATLQDLYFSAHKLFRRSNKGEWDGNGDRQWTMRNGYSTLALQLGVKDVI